MSTSKVTFLSSLAMLVAATAVASLTEQWTVIVNEYAFHRVAVVGPGNEIYWTGAVGQGGTKPPPEMLRRYRADGSMNWQKKVSGASLWAMVVAPDGSGVFVTGADAKSFPGTPWVARYDSQKGKRRWRLSLGDVTTGLATAIAVTPDGAIYVAGRIETADGSDVFVARLEEGAKMKGAVVVWLRTVDVEVIDEPTSMTINPVTGEVIVGGYCFDPATHVGADDTFLAAFTTDGDPTWSKQYSYAGMSGALLDVAASPNGKWIYGVGRMLDDGAGSNRLFFQRIAAGTGKEKKPKFYDYSPFGDQWANALAVTPDGKTILITGIAVVDAGPAHAVLVRTNNRGKQQEMVSSAVDDRYSTGVDVALDSEGNVVMAGQNGDSSFLRKYAR